MNPAESIVLVDAALRGVVVALLLLSAGLMMRDRPRLLAVQSGGLLSLGLVVQVFSSTPSFERHASCALQSPLVGLSVANAVLFWLFIRALFDDDFRWRAWHAAAWALAFYIGTLHCGTPADAPAWVDTLSGAMRRAVPVAGALLAVQAALQHWRVDLVEARRRLRFFVLVCGVAYTLIQLGLRLGATQGRLTHEAALLDTFGLLVIAVGVAWRLLRLASTELFPATVDTSSHSDDMPPSALLAEEVSPSRLSLEPAPSPQSPQTPQSPLSPPDAVDERLAEALQQSMRRDHAYRSESLNIAALAARLSVPEYRLRRHINQRLGHRNFNSYINGLRLDEARAALADPAQRDTPVLTIALTAGFQSIGPFNRSFKAQTGLTPTEFRKQNIADS